MLDFIRSGSNLSGIPTRIIKTSVLFRTSGAADYAACAKVQERYKAKCRADAVAKIQAEHDAAEAAADKSGGGKSTGTRTFGPGGGSTGGGKSGKKSTASEALKAEKKAVITKRQSGQDAAWNAKQAQIAAAKAAAAAADVTAVVQPVVTAVPQVTASSYPSGGGGGGGGGGEAAPVQEEVAPTEEVPVTEELPPVVEESFLSKYKWPLLVVIGAGVVYLVTRKKKNVV